MWAATFHPFPNLSLSVWGKGKLGYNQNSCMQDYFLTHLFRAEQVFPLYSVLQSTPDHTCCLFHKYTQDFTHYFEHFSSHFIFSSFTSICWAISECWPCLHPPLHPNKHHLILWELAACLWWAFINYVSACKLSRLAGIAKHKLKKLLKGFHGNSHLNWLYTFKNSIRNIFSPSASF